MTPSEFVRKWAAARGGERQTSQEHFIDLCRLLGEQTPNDPNSDDTFYAFEKGARTPDGDGFADVWLKGHFAWEYKGKRNDLGAAYKQVQTYREALGNPPLLVVCDIDRYEIHTNWTYTETWIYRFRNDALVSDHPVDVVTLSGPAKNPPALTALQVLKAIFEEPERLKPQRTTDQITLQAGQLFGEISDELRKWKVDDMQIARFITRVMFCMFAADVGLLPRESFSEVIAVHKRSGDNAAFRKHLSDLFRVMKDGGEFFMRHIPHFNGHLFEDDHVPEHVTTQEILTLAKLDELNWTEVEPSIFGTLFVRILDPRQRKKMGAVYTSRADIEMIVEPVLMAPLRNDWQEVRAEAEAILEPKRGRSEERAKKKAASLLRDFHKKLYRVRILDPACGSGNFLYVALALLKAMEKELIAFAGMQGIAIRPRVHPRQLYGIETNPYAHELASVVIWIGYLQWKYRNVMPLDDEEPILEPLDNVARVDAVLDRTKKPREPEWPQVDVIVGNPPFLGGGLLRSQLAHDYVETLFSVYGNRIPNFSDLCCYWFEKARAAVEAGHAKRAGLLATQAIRGGKNRRVLERIKETGDIFYAQADRKWIQDGVAVRVSMVGFDDGSETLRLLNEDPDDDPVRALERARRVPEINANLTSALDVTQARGLKENLGICFMGPSAKAPLDIDAGLARRMLAAPNPHGRPNTDVVRPVASGVDLVGRPRGKWTIDFGLMSEEEAALYEMPFEYVKKHVRPVRLRNRRRAYAERWWIYAEPRPGMRRALAGVDRFIATPELSKHRIFVWVEAATLCNQQTLVFARHDDYFFGVLHSRVHEVWARKTGTQLREAESGFRYTPTTCFETFPLPKASAKQKATIAAAAKALNELREKWLNPEGLISNRDQKKRTLTNLYNERPTWLANAHDALDRAVLAAYGWPEDISGPELLGCLLDLNLRREPAE